MDMLSEFMDCDIKFNDYFLLKRKYLMHTKWQLRLGRDFMVSKRSLAQKEKCKAATPLHKY